MSQTSLSSSSLLSTPILHIEELAKRYYDVKSKRGHTYRKKYYDVDWRFFIAHKYGQYVLCGTRCPMYDTYNEEWPVISASFISTREVFEYISLMTGANKINITLFVSETKAELLTGSTYAHSDLLFSHPTNKRFRAMESDRKNRRTELVGYDHIRLSPRTGCSESKVVRLLNVLSGLNSCNMVPFTISPRPSMQKWQQEQDEEQNERRQNERQYGEGGEGEGGEGGEGKQSENRKPASDQVHAADDNATQHDDYYDYVTTDHFD